MDTVPPDHFIPYRWTDLVSLMLTKAPAGVRPEPDDRAAFTTFSRLLGATVHQDYHDRLLDLNDLYAPFDPNADTIAIDHPDAARLSTIRADFLARLSALLTRANYQAVSPAELQEALATESVFKVRLHTQLDDFSDLVVYRRGTRRRQEIVPRFLGFGRRLIEVVYFERVVLCVRFKDSDHFAARAKPLAFTPGSMVLKMFQSIPKADLEMLLPNSEVRMRTRDKVMIGVPAAIGIAGMTAKLAVVVSFLIGMSLWVSHQTGLHDQPVKLPLNTAEFTAIAAACLTLYLFINRQLMNYRYRRIKFMQALTQGLYFKNLDNNAGVIHHVVGEAEDEDAKEALLAYGFLRTSAQGLTPFELDERIEAWFKELGQPIDFEVEDGLEKLERFGLLERRDGRLAVPPLAEATRRLDTRWDTLFTPTTA